MSILKDLFYNVDNQNLDISRLASGLSVLAYWAGVGWHTYTSADFDPLGVGGGCAALMAGCAGWIHFRQKHELPIAAKVAQAKPKETSDDTSMVDSKGVFGL